MRKFNPKSHFRNSRNFRCWGALITRQPHKEIKMEILISLNDLLTIDVHLKQCRQRCNAKAVEMLDDSTVISPPSTAGSST